MQFILAMLLVAGTSAAEEPVEPQEAAAVPVQSVFISEFEADPEAIHPPYSILGQEIAAGELRQLNWELDSAMAGLTVPTPILVAHGDGPGPTVCLIGAIHGDELNGVEIVRRIIFDLDLEELSGTLIGIPIVNSFGFLRGSRYLPDRRDLNRFFPGNLDGSMASRFAAAIFNQIISRCSVVVDIHTGSFHRTNLPQLRADLTIEPVLELTRRFGDIAVLHSEGPSGSLRRAATDAGIPALTLEAGESMRFDETSVDAGARAIDSLLAQLGMKGREQLARTSQPVFYSSTWIRAQSGGILFSNVQLGDIVEEGDQLATVTDPIENGRTVMAAPFRGRVLGMAVNQVVMPGFAAFHIGRVTSEQQAVEEKAETGLADDAVPEAGLADSGQGSNSSPAESGGAEASVREATPVEIIDVAIPTERANASPTADPDVDG